MPPLPPPARPWLGEQPAPARTGEDVRALCACVGAALGRPYDLAQLHQDLAALSRPHPRELLRSLLLHGGDVPPSLALDLAALLSFVLLTSSAPSDPPAELPPLPSRERPRKSG